MNKIALSSISIIIGFISCLLLLKSCEKPNTITKETITITTNTVYVKGDSIIIPKEIKTSYPIYIYKIPTLISNFAICDSIRFYSDTTHIDSTSYFITQDTVIGKKIASFRKYVGVPYFKQTTITIKDSIPFEKKVYQNGIYLSGGISQDGVLVGADFISKQKWAIGYNYNPITKVNSASFKYLILGR